MEFEFPVFVLAKDCGDVRKYSSVHEMQCYFEKIDVENDEYEAWDANGMRLSLSIQTPLWLSVKSAGSQQPEELRIAISGFARIQDVEADMSALSKNEFSAALDQITNVLRLRRESGKRNWWKKFMSRF
ncbi:MAG TPA: hypothetical protein VEW69_05180 [Alphaproteobacteria bacterium]|nr:hypothetical protein [Alphaproteobacteria bacterium]